ncbi:GNAT family N-acetyltransferase [Streptomyces sp. NBC_00820]|uniref:GNAT family N-acetyltransferase n=1 Tax=Streptomyces sp. NBC_00820 TaxID=2975842 RepID=UPI002ED5E67E|nr:GNAT family N-acetyltransferase [Streptomyces sp. NBC_00820]
MKPEWYTKIAEVPQWPADPRHNVFLTPGWTTSVEGALTDRQRYVLRRDETGAVRASAALYAIGPGVPPFFTPAGLASGHLRNESLLSVLSAGERQRAAYLAERIEATLGRSVVCTAPFGFTHGLSWSGRPDVLRPLVREMDEARGAWEADCSAVLYVEEGEREVREALEQEGYQAVQTGATCVLPITFDSFEGYLDTLSRRRGVLRERRVFEESGFTVGLESIEDNLDTIADMQARLQEKYGSPYDFEGERAVFRSVVENVGEYAHMLVGRRDGELLAFAVFLERAGVIHVKMAARDVGRAGTDSFAHFNLGYYAMVQEALRRGVREINYGPEGYTTKLRRGCVPRKLFWYLKGPEALGDDLAETCRLVTLMHERRIESIVEGAKGGS